MNGSEPSSGWREFLRNEGREELDSLVFGGVAFSALRGVSDGFRFPLAVVCEVRWPYAPDRLSYPPERLEELSSLAIAPQADGFGDARAAC